MSPNRQWLLPVVSSSGSGGGGNPSGLQAASATLTSANILAQTPIQVVAAPGVGKYIVPIFAVMNYKFGGTPYTIAGAGNLALGVPGIANVWMISDALGFIDQASDHIATAFLSESSVNNPPICSTPAADAQNSPVSESTVDNQPLVFMMNSSVTNGNGKLAITIWYSSLSKI